MTPAEALDKAVEAAGSLQVIADAIGVTKGAVGQWKIPGRRVPAEHCPSIEKLVKRVVTCEELRPDVDWGFIRASNKPE